MSKIINKFKVVSCSLSIFSIFGQFLSSAKKKLLIFTKNLKKLFYAFLSHKISILNEKIFSDNFLDNFWTI